MKTIIIILFLLVIPCHIYSQDTFSIVAVDTVTGEVGAAGASCVDLFAAGFTDPGFLAELFPATGAIATQASYLSANQVNARNRMNAGDSPSQIISWLVANDVQNNPGVRQYGVVRIMGSTSESASHTGVNCFTYKNHISGPNYSIQGNILLGQSILDSMEARFNAEPGNLACKLMAALQGAKVPGADTRCLNNGTSSYFSFVKVSQPGDAFNAPSLNLGVRLAANTGKEPIDSLQVLFSQVQNCTTTGMPMGETQSTNLNVFPNPAKETLNVIINHQKGNETFIIWNELGQKVKTGIFNGLYKVDIRNLETGLYFLEVISKTSSNVIKFSVAH